MVVHQHWSYWYLAIICAEANYFLRGLVAIMWHGPWSTAREVVMYFSHMTAIICDYLLPSVWGKLWHLVWIKTSRIHLQDKHYGESQNLQFSELWRLIILDICLFELCLKLMCKRCKSIPLYFFKPKSLLPLSYSSWKLVIFFLHWNRFGEMLLLTHISSTVNGCRQNESPNSW